jgi:hypothetical protein
MRRELSTGNWAILKTVETVRSSEADFRILEHEE